MYAAQDVFQWALDRADARKDAQVPPARRLVSVCRVVADESAVPDEVRSDVRAKYRAVVRDCRSAKDRDFQKTEGACLAAPVHRDALVYPGARERFPALRPQAAPLKAVYLRAPQQLAEPARLRSVKLEPRDEYVSARLAQAASRRLEHLLASARAALEQFSESQARQPKA